MVYLWRTCGVHGVPVAHMWCTRGAHVHVAHTWRTRGAHVAHTWRTRGAHVAHTWCACGAHVAHTWCTTWRTCTRDVHVVYGAHMASAPMRGGGSPRCLGAHVAHTWRTRGAHVAHMWVMGAPMWVMGAQMPERLDFLVFKLSGPLWASIWFEAAVLFRRRGCPKLTSGRNPGKVRVFCVGLSKIIFFIKKLVTLRIEP
jgi:hypothetical protein